MKGLHVNIIISAILYVLALAMCLSMQVLSPSQWMITPRCADVTAQLTRALAANKTIQETAFLQLEAKEDLQSACEAMSQIDLSGIARNGLHQTKVAFYANIIACVTLLISAMLVVPRRYWHMSIGIILSSALVILYITYVSIVIIDGNQSQNSSSLQVSLHKYPSLLAQWPKIVSQENEHVFALINFHGITDSRQSDVNNNVSDSINDYSEVKNRYGKSIRCLNIRDNQQSISVKLCATSHESLVMESLSNHGCYTAISMLWNESIAVIDEELNSRCIISQIVDSSPPIVQIIMTALMIIGVPLIFVGLWLIQPFKLFFIRPPSELINRRKLNPNDETVVEHTKDRD